MFRTPDKLNIISIDPSLRSSGVFMCKQGKIESYAIQRKEGRMDVLGYYVKHFAKLAREIKWDLVIIEDYAFSRQSQSVTTQAEIGGIIRACFSANHIPIFELNISTWKAIIGIRAKKISVQEKSDYKNMCIERFGFTFTTTDEVDAFYMFWTAVQCSRGNFIKGSGSKVRTALEEMKIQL